MIEGFLTRPSTDLPVRFFVESAGGYLHKPLEEGEVDKFISKKWPTFIKERKRHGWAINPCVVFGILRGTDTIIRGCEKRGLDYYYLDHCYIYKGYKHSNHPHFNDRIYRICKNEQSLTKIDTLDEEDRKRVEWYKSQIPVPISDWKKDGKHILVIPPSLYMKRFYNMNVILPEFSSSKDKRTPRKTILTGKESDRIFVDIEANYDNDEFWEKDIVTELKKHTDREIRVRYKDSPNTFEQDLENAWAVVSSQSTGAIDAILKGIPSFCESTSATLPMSLTDLSKIETPFYPDNRQEWVDSLIANQYTLKEIRTGVAWRRLQNK